LLKRPVHLTAMVVILLLAGIDERRKKTRIALERTGD